MNQTCYHCGQAVPHTLNLSLEILAEQRQFCCPSCQSVAQLIVEAGLVDFYRYRTQVSPRPEESIPPELQLYDQPEIQQDFVRCREQFSEVTLLLDGINCAACGWLIERSLAEFAGVGQIQVNVTSQQALLLWSNQQVSLSQILARISQLGFKARPHQPQVEEVEFQKRNRQLLLAMGVAGIGMMLVMTFSVAIYVGLFTGMAPEFWHYLRWVTALVSLPILAYSARSFFDNAWKGLAARRLVMDFPVSVAMTLAVGASLVALVRGEGEIYFDSLVMFSFFLLCGRYLEMRARRRASRGLYSWYSLLPLITRRLTADGQIEEVPLARVQPGDLLLIRAGDTIAADGVLRQGETSCNEAILTGESLPVARGVGDRLLAGSLNLDSPIQLEVHCTGAQTRLAQIQSLLAQGQQQRPYAAQLVDALSGWFITAVLIASGLTWLGWQYFDPSRAFWAALSVLVVTCPCALSLATPAALTCAMGYLSQRGVLVRQGQALERLPKITKLALDKTGTLTTGAIEIAEVRVLGSLTSAQVLALAALLEQESSHPVARAFASYCPPDQHLLHQNFPGRGVAGHYQGQDYRLGKPSWLQDWHQLSPPDDSAWLLLASASEALAWFRLTDSLRPGVAAMLQQFNQAGIPLVLLSGDPSANAPQLAAELAIGECHHGLSPEQKLALLQSWQQQGERVLMLGDGINDAPVLAAAWVSASVSEGTDLAKMQSDLILLTDNMGALFAAWSHAKKTRRIIGENLAWSLVYNVSVLPLAAMGKVAPYMAAIGMSLSSLLVVLNALRLDRRRSTSVE